MSQTGHDPHGYNLMTYQRHNLGLILLAISVNIDTRNQLINVSNKARSTWQQSRELLKPQPGRDLVGCQFQYRH